jgi:hypothetical protein
MAPFDVLLYTAATMESRELWDAVRRSSVEMFSDVTGGFSFNVSQVLVGFIALFLGCMAAAIVYVLGVRILRFFAVDKLVAKTPLHSVLHAIGVRRNAAEILVLLVATLVVGLAFEWAAKRMALSGVFALITAFVGYLPAIITAFVILMLGALGARFVLALTVQVLQRTRVGYERAVGAVLQWLVFLLVALIAVGQLGIDLSPLTTNVSILVAMFVGAAGLAGIVGARPLLENAFLCRQLRNVIGPGTTVEIAGITGHVREFTPTSVVLEHDGRRTVLSASHFYDHPYAILP